jgi:hypothetical protein
MKRENVMSLKKILGKGSRESLKQEAKGLRNSCIFSLFSAFI